MIVDYSLMILTYNPDERILGRCLQAVYNLDKTDLNIEIILVDNNSKEPVQDSAIVKKYAALMPSMRMLFVAEQGEKYARMAAIEQSAGRFIISFDYDNEPHSNYLQELHRLIQLHPNVAAWGPGNLWVDFIDGIPASISNYARIAFQERHETEVVFSNNKEDWQSCYPFGSGLSARAEILKEYVMRSKQGEFTLAGRKGKKLSSGADTQMVLLCIRNGYSAGVSPGLQMKHIIPGDRANSSYLERLAYGTSVCYDTCFSQVFPQRLEELPKRIMPARKFSRKAFKKFVKTKLRSDPHSRFELAAFLGANAGIYLALQKPLPAVVNSLVRYLKLG